MSNNDFLETLASCQDACASMDISDSGWNPPNGEYTVLLSRVETGAGKKKAGVFVKPFFTISDAEDDDLEGKTFSDYFFIVPNANPSNYGDIAGLIGLSQLATCIAGREIRDAIEANTILDAAAGEEFLRVEMYRTKDKKGKEWPHTRFLGRVEVSSDEEIKTADVDPAVAE